VTQTDAAPATAASSLRRKWLDRAFDAAGIDQTHWDPTRGVDANRRTIERVYDYYGRLYVEHPRLEWAGMANLIGPSFYAGFLDVGFLPDLARRVLPRRTANVGDLGFFETTFLTMQRKIFEDQALMHEAYLGEGVEAVEELGEAGVADSATVRAWRRIDGRDPAGVHEGNRTLLYREQHDIIDRFYVEMTEHAPPAGRLFTYGMTLAGTPAIPGARGYCDAYPLTLPWRRAPIRLRTPLAAGNIAVFADRWQLIEDDTLPAYRRLLGAKGEVSALVERPLQERVGRFRLTRRAGRIARAALTNWRVLVGGMPAAAVPAGDSVHVDLAATAGLEGRIWANPQRRPFEIAVALPGGRTFASEAVLVTLPATDPPRLTVKLPATDLDGARRTLAVFAEDWGIDESQIAAWSARAAAATTASHAYAARVFPAAPVGDVRIEVQVEHHVETDTYVLDVLFSWSRP
jgi:hypothetical protein